MTCILISTLPLSSSVALVKFFCVFEVQRPHMLILEWMYANGSWILYLPQSGCLTHKVLWLLDLWCWLCESAPPLQGAPDSTGETRPQERGPLFGPDNLCFYSSHGQTSCCDSCRAAAKHSYSPSVTWAGGSQAKNSRPPVDGWIHFCLEEHPGGNPNNWDDTGLVLNAFMI